MKTKVRIAAILAVLGESPLPVSTADLEAILGVPRANRRRLWQRLKDLERRGLVRRAGALRRPTERLGDRTVTLWAGA